jgi:hypothetical protein
MGGPTKWTRLSQTKTLTISSPPSPRKRGTWLWQLAIPDITEQADVKARIIGYGYGPKYVDMVCVIMPTRAGVNQGMAYAMELPDPKKLLGATGKLHRHVKIKSKSDLESGPLKCRL